MVGAYSVVSPPFPPSLPPALPPLLFLLISDFPINVRMSFLPPSLPPSLPSLGNKGRPQAHNRGRHSCSCCRVRPSRLCRHKTDPPSLPPSLPSLPP